MNERERRKILFFLKKHHGLFQSVGDAAPNFFPELAGGVIYIFDLSKQSLVKIADLQLYRVKP